jgi:hypothetical protein
MSFNPIDKLAEIYNNFSAADLYNNFNSTAVQETVKSTGKGLFDAAWNAASENPVTAAAVVAGTGLAFVAGYKLHKHGMPSFRNVLPDASHFTFGKQAKPKNA